MHPPIYLHTTSDFEWSHRALNRHLTKCTVSVFHFSWVFFSKVSIYTSHLHIWLNRNDDVVTMTISHTKAREWSNKKWVGTNQRTIWIIRWLSILKGEKWIRFRFGSHTHTNANCRRCVLHTEKKLRCMHEARVCLGCTHEFAGVCFLYAGILPLGIWYTIHPRNWIEQIERQTQ